MNLKPLKKSSLGVIASETKQSRGIAAAPSGPRNDFFRGFNSFIRSSYGTFEKLVNFILQARREDKIRLFSRLTSFARKISGSFSEVPYVFGLLILLLILNGCSSGAKSSEELTSSMEPLTEGEKAQAINTITSYSTGAIFKSLGYEVTSEKAAGHKITFAKAKKSTASAGKAGKNLSAKSYAAGHIQAQQFECPDNGFVTVEGSLTDALCAQSGCSNIGDFSLTFDNCTTNNFSWDGVLDASGIIQTQSSVLPSTSKGLSTKATEEGTLANGSFTFAGKGLVTRSGERIATLIFNMTGGATLGKDGHTSFVPYNPVYEAVEPPCQEPKDKYTCTVGGTTCEDNFESGWFCMAYVGDQGCCAPPSTCRSNWECDQKDVSIPEIIPEFPGYICTIHTREPASCDPTKPRTDVCYKGATCQMNHLCNCAPANLAVTCGNGTCDIMTENRRTCSKDCTFGLCGNLACEQGEDDPNTKSCKPEEGLEGSKDCYCPSDCCNNNYICESSFGENSSNCRSDCGCNLNHSCEPARGEDWTCEDCRAACGNFRCELDENRRNCPTDCQTDCGNRICDCSIAGGACEDVWSCPQDCPGECGNGLCEPGEYQWIGTGLKIYCSQDCKCGDVDGKCDSTPSYYEVQGVCLDPNDRACFICPQDCRCGNGVCEQGDNYYEAPLSCTGVSNPNCVVCQQDCSCGNGQCDSSLYGYFEAYLCPTDWPYILGRCVECPGDCTEPARCGNGRCDPQEMYDEGFVCPDDCCGDNWCMEHIGFGNIENRYTCPKDCCDSVCGNEICEVFQGETHASCSRDCKCGNGVCNSDECAWVFYDPISNPSCKVSCDDDCHCPDGDCQSWYGEDNLTCLQDCPPPPPHCTNGICEPDLGENETNCTDDCGCNHMNGCELVRGENHINCPDDCTCEDKICSQGEAESCPAEQVNYNGTDYNIIPDCCTPDEYCNSGNGESYSTCPMDCTCGNGICEDGSFWNPNYGENRYNCPADCRCGYGSCDQTANYHEAIACTPTDKTCLDCAVHCAINNCLCMQDNTCFIHIDAETDAANIACIQGCMDACNCNFTLDRHCYECPQDCACNGTCDICCQGENCNFAEGLKCNCGASEDRCDLNSPYFQDECMGDCLCGNGLCESLPENGYVEEPSCDDLDIPSPPCFTCPTDCSVRADCGNGVCETALGENNDNCPVDCPLSTCGDGNHTCDDHEVYSCYGSLPVACRECLDPNCPECDHNFACLYYSGCLDLCGCSYDLLCQDCPSDGCTCGDGTCDFSHGYGPENPANCPGDCGYCGDGICSDVTDENYGNCPDDCLCGDYTCETWLGETVFNCNVDCGYCGDGQCQLAAGENSDTCRSDCGICGDGTCNEFAGETNATCPADCLCGNGICEPDEDFSNCPGDCPLCGNGVCGDGPCEDATLCPQDCGGTIGE